MNNRFFIKLLIFSGILFFNNLVAADYPYTGFAIGTDGQLYCRIGIDSSNLDGTGWANIALPPFASQAVTIKSCAVSAFGVIWIVDAYGFISSAQLTQSHLQKTSPGQTINLAWTNRENPAPN